MDATHWWRWSPNATSFLKSFLTPFAGLSRQLSPCAFCLSSLLLIIGSSSRVHNCSFFVSFLLLCKWQVLRKYFLDYGIMSIWSTWVDWRVEGVYFLAGSMPKFMFIASVMPSYDLMLWCPLLFLPSIFPSIRDFSNESAVCIKGPKYWSFSFSISLPTSIQGWFPLRLAGLISLLSRGLSGFFSSTTVWRHQFFGILPFLRSSSHNHTWPLGRPALTIRTFVCSNVCAFQHAV